MREDVIYYGGLVASVVVGSLLTKALVLGGAKAIQSIQSKTKTKGE